jgi:hypothetical protein
MDRLSPSADEEIADFKEKFGGIPYIRPDRTCPCCKSQIDLRQEGPAQSVCTSADIGVYLHRVVLCQKCNVCVRVDVLV